MSTSTITVQDLAVWLSEQTWSDFAQSLAAAYFRWGNLTPRQEAAARSMHQKVEARRAQRVTVPDPTPGFYRVPERYATLRANSPETWYRVQKARGGDHVYAKVWDEASSTWAYDGRAAFASLTPDRRVTAEEAAAFGHAHGRCLKCGAELTDPESVKRGIGPVCAKKLARIQGW